MRKIKIRKLIFIDFDFRSDPDNQNDAILSWGDVRGDVHAILFNSALIALFERPPQQSNNTGMFF